MLSYGVNRIFFRCLFFLVRNQEEPNQGRTQGYTHIYEATQRNHVVGLHRCPHQCLPKILCSMQVFTSRIMSIKGAFRHPPALQELLQCNKGPTPSGGCIQALWKDTRPQNQQYPMGGISMASKITMKASRRHSLLQKLQHLAEGTSTASRTTIEASRRETLLQDQHHLMEGISRASRVAMKAVLSQIMSL
jgi:hypothetical protein